MLKSIKCTSCGATLRLSGKDKIQFCPYCGAAFELASQETIENQTNIKNQINVRISRVTNKKGENDNSDKWMVAFLIVLLLIFTIFAILPHVSKNRQLEALAAEIRTDIIEGRYDEALVKTTNLRLEDGFSSDDTRRWDRERNELINMIKEKKKGK